MTTKTGYDSVDASNLPRDAEVVFAYVCGQYANVASVRTRCPKARLITICVDGLHAADMLDVERYDAKPADAPLWVRRLRSVGRRPVVYCSRSAMGTVEAQFSAIGEPPPFYGIADWTNASHLVSGSVGTQWANGSAAYPGYASGCDTWTISPNWPDRFQEKGRKPVKITPTQRQRFASLVRQAAAIVGVVIGLGNQLHLPPAVRSVLVVVSGGLLWIEHHEGSSGTASPPPPAA